MFARRGDRRVGLELIGSPHLPKVRDGDQAPDPGVVLRWHSEIEPDGPVAGPGRIGRWDRLDDEHYLQIRLVLPVPRRDRPGAT